jgi:DNA polymerase (family 10)
MNNVQIADVFDQIGDLLEFQDANPFRVRAYRNAARTIRDLPESAEEILADPNRRLTDIGGIGKDLAEKIGVLVQTGTLPMLEELLEQVPRSVLAILRVPGLGPKRAAALYHELGVSNLGQLREACQQHKVRELKGFGAKTEEAILGGLEIASQAERRTYWAEADLIAQDILKHLRQCRAITKMEVAGSYRRKRDTVGDLDVLVIAKDATEAMDCFASYPGLAQVLARGETKMSVRLDTGLQVDLRVVPPESFGAALQYFTGSKEHNVILRGMAKARGLKINEYGVFRGEKSIAGRKEEDVYGALDLPWFPPEIREARQEFQWAEAGRLPELVELSDLRGDLHAHTTWSDGGATIEEMAAAAQERGLKYLAITDHSQRTTIANGLDAKRLRRQWAEVDKINQRLRGFTLLKGVEVDILERGGLDLDDEVLAEADWVVASVHFGQNQSREQITRRVIGALENPYVSAIAHPTGRLINERKAYEIDLDTVLRAARDQGKLMELNANPRRLDLDDVACSMAKGYGVPVVISTDAHSINGLDVLRYGVLQARRGGLTKKDVANTRTWPQLRKLLE